ncbi:DUF7146 domain-containing protein [Ruegeria atlantica]|uniref:DUF7146 domain-containing protein n=1 Tax=Ruegeria atlantica TaxID=81569 RepID=UPI00147C1EBD|nr:toprim domain-containing protein [Ruegeria atlantica]
MATYSAYDLARHYSLKTPIPGKDEYSVKPCPMCAENGTGGTLHISTDEHGNPWVRCHAYCGFDVWEILERDGFKRPRRPRNASRQARNLTEVEAKRERAAEIFDHAHQISETSPVGLYLISRGLPPPWPPTLREVMALNHPTGTKAPALVAAVERLADLHRVGVARQWLTPEGRKIDADPQKATLGPIKGGGVRLAPLTDRIGLAEGIETALSAQRLYDLPTIATLGTNGLLNIELPDAVRSVVLFLDGDPQAEKTAALLGVRLRSEGRTVAEARAPAGTDFNDLLQRSLTNA